MKTKYTFCSILFALMTLYSLNAQNYDGYDYVEPFSSSTVKGVISPIRNYEHNIASGEFDVNSGYLRFSVSGASGSRYASFTMDETVHFTKKMIVEFDWYPVNVTQGGTNEEGMIQFRDESGNPLFSLYNVRSSGTIGIVVGSFEGLAAAVNQTYHTILTGTSSAWYHVKAEIYDRQRICFTITGTGTSAYNRQVMHPVPQGFSSTNINTIHISSTRNSSGVNVSWETRIRNLGVRVADSDPVVEATGVSIAAANTTIDHLTGATALTATIEPWNVSDRNISWSIDSDKATIDTGDPSWTATLTGAGKGGGTVTVTATSATAGVIGTKEITVIEPPRITDIAISGPDAVSVFSGITLTPEIIPEDAFNKNVVWTLDNRTVASVYANTDGRALVTGISEGAVTVRVTSLDKPEIFAEKTIVVTPSTLPQRQMERLDRGLVAVKNGENIFFSWRLFSTDPLGVTFHLYRNNETTPINPQPLDAAHTNFAFTNGTMNARYAVATLVNDVEIERSEPVRVWDNQYLSIPVEKPAGRLWNGSSYATYTDYHIGDASVADLDGDGQYEIVFLWMAGNAQDNANSGHTANVFLDAYKLDGTKLWGAGKFIDLGPNIRAGAHYNTFLVYDFDGDGKAEIIVKTADGTVDAFGTRIGNTNNYTNGSGYILSGDEFLSVFEGATGKLLDTKPFAVARGTVNDWGDNYGNRVDRYLAAVAYLDGERPSAVMCRGYYARTTLTAWDWDGRSLKQRWVFDTKEMPAAQRGLYEGQGNHNLSVADVNGDGKDEIMYGAIAVNNDGTPLYSTNFRHGDAMHTGKLVPSRAGLQVMRVCESPNPWGMEMHDAATGELIWGVRATGDIGRGLTADIDPEYPGTESWSSLGTHSAQGQRLANSLSYTNMAVYWDGNTGRELFDCSASNGANPFIARVTASAGSGGDNPRSYATSNLITFTGTSTNGGSKQNPCLQADIIGDWREEMILRASDNSELRIYTTIIETEHTGAGAVPSAGIPTLMHDPVYRMAVAWQNTGYNQPPHTGFFLGYNMENIPRLEGAVFTVTFDPNGGVFEDNTTDIKQIFSISGGYFTFPKVTMPDKNFEGWYFTDGSLFDPAYLYKEDITLKAEWNPGCILSFDANVSGMTNPKSKRVTSGEAAGDLPALSRTGYALTGWNTQLDASGQQFTSETVVSVNVDFTLYAVWTPNVYTLNFHKNAEDATVSPVSKNVSYEVAVGELPVPLQTGFAFTGWNTETDGSGEKYTEATVYRLLKDLTLYAQWTPRICTISFDLQIEGITNPQSKKVTYNTAVGVLQIPSRTGYTFGGWNTEKEGTGLTFTESTVFLIDNDIVLYAQWIPNAVYTLTFDANAADITITPATINVTYDVAVGELPAPTRTGYTFDGWNTAADGSGTTYTASTVYTENSDLTLYAQWIANTYTLRFLANASGITITPETKDVTYGETVGELPVPVQTGYHFDGWNTQANGSGDTYTASTVYLLLENLTLYAKWNVPTSVSEFENDHLKIYPNPAKDVIYISGLEGGEIITVIDVSGRKWMQIKANKPTEEIAVSHLPKGACIVIIAKDQTERTIKLMIE